MNRREVLVGAAAAALGLSRFPYGWAADAEGPRRRVLFFTKSSGFEHSVIRRQGDKLGYAEQILTDLGGRHGFEVTCTKDGGVFTPGNLARYDAIAFYTTGDLTQPGADRNPPMSAEGKAALLEAVHDGKGFVGMHSATDTFHSRPDANVDPYIGMIGAEFIRHGAQQKAKMQVTDRSFPGFSGFSDSFELLEEWYALRNYAPNLHVLLVQDTTGMQGTDYQRPPYPATWARRHGRGRVFYTSMGHREDVWTNSIFQNVLLGGLAWAMGNLDADVAPNLEKVTPGYKELPPGVGATRGVSPK